MNKDNHRQGNRRGFTLMELLIVMSILAILAGLTVAGMAAVVNSAREARTRSIIGKIDLLIDERWEGYRTRAMPVRIGAGTTPLDAARGRLYVMRALQRMELPDRRTDIVNYTTDALPPPNDHPTLEIAGVAGMAQPSLLKTYFRQAVRNTGGNPNNSATWDSLNSWTREHEGSECLYLILSAMRDGDKSALDFFSADEIGDTDGDGMREILDGWGRPIGFLRWAPGYSQHPGPDGEWGDAGANDDGDTANKVDDIFEAGWPTSDDVVPVTPQTRIASPHPDAVWAAVIPTAPDPFDPVKADPRWRDPVNFLPNALKPTEPFALKPLIFSAGLDGNYDIETSLENRDVSPAEDFRYSQSQSYALPPLGSVRVPNDPYFVPPASWNQFQPGTIDINAGGWSDNITNHDFDTN
jgi:prepilin-type N-terminal cleavage/methylation domain-containing protein